MSGTTGSALLVGDHLAYFKTLEPFEEDAAEETGQADTGENKSSDPAALSVDGHLGNIRDFVLAVREEREPQVSAPEARRAVTLLNMIYRKAGVGPFA